ncbi:hypothetical protein DY000_02051304 [Brassica cretica]|uniref:RNase H type-1 domain-containing protein n=1 Tax=Brassica cretica TaxID=69181 RepID=A0ABQ7EUJ1_BRACR|nr:hypothetical protein DY000_02051304 [Brassica cretica]
MDILSRDQRNLPTTLGKAIRNRNSTKVWNDSWISTTSHIVVYGSPTEATRDLYVSDLLLRGTGEWNRHMVEAVLPELAEDIYQIKPSIFQVEDTFCWQKTKSVFENRQIPATTVVFKACSSGREWLQAQVPTSTQLRPALLEFEIPPTRMNVTLCNSDAAWSSASHRAAEAVAMRETMLEAKRLSLTKVWFRTDSRELARAIFSKSYPVELFGVLMDIEILSSSFIFYFISFVGREYNVAADFLAKAALSCEWNRHMVEAVLPELAEDIYQIKPSIFQVEDTFCWQKTKSGTGADIHTIATRSLRVQNPPTRMDVTLCNSDAAWSSTNHRAAEAVAMRKTMMEAKRLSLTKVWFRTNSRELARAIFSKSYPVELFGVLMDIEILSSSFIFYFISFVGREYNVAADFLAKAALSCSSPALY